MCDAITKTCAAIDLIDNRDSRILEMEIFSGLSRDRSFTISLFDQAIAK